MSSVPRDKAGVGSAMNDTTREVGTTLGVAVLGSILSSGYTSNLGDVANAAGAAQHAVEGSLAGARLGPTGRGHGRREHSRCCQGRVGARPAVVDDDRCRHRARRRSAPRGSCSWRSRSPTPKNTTGDEELPAPEGVLLAWPIDRQPNTSAICSSSGGGPCTRNVVTQVSPPPRQLVADLLRRTDQGDVLHHRERYGAIASRLRPRGRVLGSGRPPPRSPCARTRRVEVHGLGAHPADVEREHRTHEVGGLDVVVDDHRARIDATSKSSNGCVARRVGRSPPPAHRGRRRPSSVRSRSAASRRRSRRRARRSSVPRRRG